MTALPIPKHLLLAIMLIAGNFVNAQDSTITTHSSERDIQKIWKLKFGIIGLAPTLELPINNRTVFLGEVGVGGGMSFSISRSGTYFGYAARPYARAGIRNYYNITKRKNLGKNTVGNAADFFSFELEAGGPTVIYSNDLWNEHGIIVASANWGMQRNLSNRLSFEWQAGIGAGV